MSNLDESDKAYYDFFDGIDTDYKLYCEIESHTMSALYLESHGFESAAKALREHIEELIAEKKRKWEEVQKRKGVVDKG